MVKVMGLALPNESELYFERGGPIHRFMQRIGVTKGEDPSIKRRILWFIAVTWVPLLVFAIVDGRALGPSPRESMLLDFATYARFFLTVPLLVIAENIIGPRLRDAALRFLRDGLVRREDLHSVEVAIEKVRHRREALGPELSLLAISFVTTWYLSADQWYAGNASSWKSFQLSGGGTSLAGLWYQFFAIPFVQFLILRWLWRLIIWICFLYQMSRIDLNLAATHPDGAGGLGFLGTAHSFLGFISFGIGMIVSADAAFRILFEGATIKTFQWVFISYVAINEILSLSPLLLFTPILFRTRLEWLRNYDSLAFRYDRAFHEKWVNNAHPPEEPLLGTSDIQSLADLGNSIDRVRAMNAIPFEKRLVLHIAVMSALPALPLLFMLMPVMDILRILGGVIL
jgi:hypothetical protein